MFFVNQKVVCISDHFDPIVWGNEYGVEIEETLPTKGQIYSIRRIFQDPFDGNILFHLHEIKNPELPYYGLNNSHHVITYEVGFHTSRFKPLISIEDDMKMFREISEYSKIESFTST